MSCLRLSDLYKEDGGSEYWEAYPLALECVAVMFNINYGHNEKLMGSCRRLHDYAYFVQSVKEGQAQGLSLEAAVRVAIDECIEKDVLTDLLVKSRSEVYHMLLTEFDEKAYKKRLYSDGVRDGMEQGIEQGISILISVEQNHGISYEDTEKIIQEKFFLKKDEAKQYMEKYWRY